MEPQILACIEGYISTSSMVKSMSFSKICATFCWRLLSSEGLQNLYTMNKIFPPEIKYNHKPNLHI